MIQDLNRLMDYIEERLTDELSLAEAAKTIGISEYHLKRTFSFIAGISLVEYIKNRRLRQMCIRDSLSIVINQLKDFLERFETGRATCLQKSLKVTSKKLFLGTHFILMLKEELQ